LDDVHPRPDDHWIGLMQQRGTPSATM